MWMWCLTCRCITTEIKDKIVSWEVFIDDSHKYYILKCPHVWLFTWLFCSWTMETPKVFLTWFSAAKLGSLLQNAAGRFALKFFFVTPHCIMQKSLTWLSTSFCSGVVLILCCIIQQPDAPYCCGGDSNFFSNNSTDVKPNFKKI